MSEHTQAPWTWYWKTSETNDSEADCGVYSEVRLGHAFSVCRAPRYQTKSQWEADARLICAAPELLAALKVMTKKFVNCARGSGSDQWAIDAATEDARAAISKAEGA